MLKVTSFLLAAAIIILNYVDYLSTKKFLMSGLAEQVEHNFIMVKAIETGNFEVKLLTVPLSVLFLVAVRDHKEKLVDGGMYLITVAYLILNMYHLHIYLTIYDFYPILRIMLFPISLS